MQERRRPLRLYEVAEQLGTSPMTVYRLIRARRLSAFRAGMQWRVTLEALEEYIRRGSSPAAEQDAVTHSL